MNAETAPDLASTVPAPGSAAPELAVLAPRTRPGPWDGRSRIVGIDRLSWPGLAADG
jgi:hypothetical protein